VENRDRFAQLIRAIADPDGVAALVGALGFDTEPAIVPREQLPVPGLGDRTALRALYRIARRRSVQVLLAEVEGEPLPRLVTDLAARLQRYEPAMHTLLFAVEPDYRRIAIASPGLAGVVRHLTLEPGHLRPSDVDAVADLAAHRGEGGIALALRWERALDRTRVTGRFFVDFRAQRARVAAAWTGVPLSARADRDQLALLFLCRVMFLYFLQRHGHLAGDVEYVIRLFRSWRSAPTDHRTFHRTVLDSLFFGVLNTRPTRRSPDAKRLGELPYLNGGLFERSGLERRHPDLDLPDAVVAGVFDNLFEKYRFTTSERPPSSGDGEAVGVDPEMLGRVFEGMMGEERRGSTGTFFTPARVVDQLVRATLAAHLSERLGLPGWVATDLVVGCDGRVLEEGQRSRVSEVLRDLRVLDPACGSGAFLLGALSRLAPLRADLDGCAPAEARRDIVGRSLYGVDIQPDAALLCALRLWLALTLPVKAGSIVPPLPNLDGRIRQGDTLLDPIELAATNQQTPNEWPGSAGLAVRRAATALAPLAERYVGTEPGERECVAREVRQAERDLAMAWLETLDHSLAAKLAELRARAADRDLWGDFTAAATDARARIPRAESERASVAALRMKLTDDDALPFFSFAVHFANPEMDGFNVILTNPPWVRALRWPLTLRRTLRNRYRVCREAGWREGSRVAHAPLASGAQTDLALLFLEQSLRLLAPRGALGALLPARLLRSMYGAVGRRLLLDDSRLIEIADHSLHQHSIFTADAFATSIVAVRRDEGEADNNEPTRNRDDRRRASVRVSLHRRAGQPLGFSVPLVDLPVLEGDPASPWLLVPPAVRSAIRRMQRSGPRLGRVLRIRRGVFTGANDVLVVREVVPRIGGLVSIRTEGWTARPAASPGDRRRSAPASRPRSALAVADPEAAEPAPSSAADFEAVVEAACLRPLVRGCDVAAWSRRESRWVIWSHGDDGRATAPLPRTLAYLRRHEPRLLARTGLRRGASLGSIFRVSREALGHKVVWHDLARTLEAVAVPAVVNTAIGKARPIVPLNTTYFIAAPSAGEAMLLAALLNSLPVRCFARSIAERAKDARFRFFAWTVGILPLPHGWRDAPGARRLAQISRDAHATGRIDESARAELDSSVAALYGLSGSDITAMAEFDAWLSGNDLE
jgi:Eco57I restriction-modification methylase